MSRCNMFAAAMVASLVSLSSVMADSTEQFKELDTSGDGKLSLAEFTAGKTGDDKTKAEAAFKEYDADADKSLSKDEYEKFYEEKNKEKEAE